jgi:nicotinamide-nucleotide amidase
MNFNNKLLTQAGKLVALALKSNSIITTAESCTGGLISSLITSISGSSSIFDCGFVTYSNNSKNKSLGIENEILETFGAVSEQVAKQMSRMAINKSSRANLSISTTGIAGPNSDGSSKKVGLVFIASFNKKNDKLIVRKFQFSGDRDEIRNLSVLNAVLILIEQIENE